MMNDFLKTWHEDVDFAVNNYFDVIKSSYFSDDLCNIKRHSFDQNDFVRNVFIQSITKYEFVKSKYDFISYICEVNGGKCHSDDSLYLTGFVRAKGKLLFRLNSLAFDMIKNDGSTLISELAVNNIMEHLWFKLESLLTSNGNIQKYIEKFGHNCFLSNKNDALDLLKSASTFVVKEIYFDRDNFGDVDDTKFNSSYSGGSIVKGQAFVSSFPERSIPLSVVMKTFIEKRLSHINKS
jgi:hypothetical protein